MNLNKNNTSYEDHEEINKMYIRALETKIAILNNF